MRFSGLLCSRHRTGLRGPAARSPRFVLRMSLKHCLQIGIDYLVLEVYPDALVTAAVEGSTGKWTMLIDRTSAWGSIQVFAVAIGILGDDVGKPQVPFDDAFVNILLRQR